MPPLLTADRFTLRERWTAVLAAAALALAGVYGTGLWEAARALASASADRHDWSGADLAAAPAAADAGALAGGIDGPTASAHLTAPGLSLDLVWETYLEVTAVRAETYEDVHGTGIRVAVAATTATEGGPHCLNARAATAAGPTLLQACVRGDRHEPPDTAVLPGDGEDGPWRPDDVFITQTANLDPAGFEPLIDYFGLGFDTGNPYDSRLWGPNAWWPQHQPPPECATDPGLVQRLHDLHLTDRYADPAAHAWTFETVPTAAPAFPVEDRLVLPACLPVGTDHGTGTVAFEPFTDPGPVPLARWAEFNAAGADPQPLRTVVAFDARTCDTAAAACSSDTAGSGPALNTGAVSDWLPGLLDP
ncbi:hypothetical protein GCM10009830_43060 [Glycomyces endophyticus]|uniref:Uncharacterized protein n=1 Tax=Glycomyces endophyticus TaxID=480996 RepID=A0ABN2HNC6_9ACTN